MIFIELNLEAPPLEHSGLPLYQRKQREEDLRNKYFKGNVDVILLKEGQIY